MAGKNNFDSFIVSACNRQAYAACMQIATAADSGITVLYGPSSCGKSHLLGALAEKYSENFPEKKVLETTPEAIFDGYLKALKEGTYLDYGKQICSYDLLIVDNAQFLAGKTATQEEMANWLCQMYGAGKTVVMAMDCPPACCETMLEKISSRCFDGWRIVKLLAPDRQLRAEYVKRLCREYSISLSIRATDHLIFSRNIPFGAIRGELMKLRLLQE